MYFSPLYLLVADHFCTMSSRFLYVEVNDNPMSMMYLGFMITVNIVGFLFLLAVSFVISRKIKKSLTKELFGVQIIVFSLTMRIAITLLFYIVDVLSNGQRQTYGNGFLQTIPWLGVLYGLSKVLKDLIVVPNSRRKQMGRIRFTLNTVTLFVLAGAFMGLLNPDSDSEILLVVILLLLAEVIMIWVIVILLYRESFKLSSKLSTIRLKMAVSGTLMIALSFTSTPFVITMAIIGLLDNTMRLYNAMLVAIFTIVAGVMFYWTFFTPRFMKRRYGLLVESMI